MNATRARPGKRIIVCCDGTWQDADSGFTKPTLVPYQPLAMLQIPSNVVRIGRAMLREDHDGVPQIVYYHSGVGTSNAVDKVFGGLLGSGVTENIREAYSFITTNYVPGDEITLVGFSRGAFTVRSVASMIESIGLLTRDGMSKFYAIFKDFENRNNKEYHDMFPDIPFEFKPGGPNSEREYREKLVEKRLTRTHNPDGSLIRIHAVAVWDTVGSLGVPAIGWLQKLGFPHSTKELKFGDTKISNFVRHAFQALALDEHRAPFSPAVWERDDVGGCEDLRQVWFPGSHANIGGGWPDQEIANITLAWMMDQLASVGIAFRDHSIDRYYEENKQFYEKPPPKKASALAFLSKKPWTQWAVESIFEKHRPVRPWGLGEIYEAETGFYHIAGKVIRSPGLYKRADPDSGYPTSEPLRNTNERIHSCVRIRLELGGLGMDDIGLYKNESLNRNGPWELQQIRVRADSRVREDHGWSGSKYEKAMPAQPSHESELQWAWKYVGPRDKAPSMQYMMEEQLGPYEERLLKLSTGMLQAVKGTAEDEAS